jgi:coenzyme PQQ precursor peptide PqqA
MLPEFPARLAGRAINTAKTDHCAGACAGGGVKYNKHRSPRASLDQPLRQTMLWTKPQFEDIRFGFEITMYVATR